MAATLKLLQTLESFNAGLYPNPEDDNPRQFELRDFLQDEEQLRDFYKHVTAAFKSGSVGRFVWNAITAFDPKNKIIDQDADTLELHQNIQNALRERKYYDSLIKNEVPEWLPAKIYIPETIINQETGQVYEKGEQICETTPNGGVTICGGIELSPFFYTEWKKNEVAK